MQKNCKNSTNVFRYFCGELSTELQQNAITPSVKRASELYLGFPNEKSIDDNFHSST